MILKRKIYDQMLEWKKLSAGSSAILIEGARRIGKSTVAVEFAKNEYEDHLILDFAQEPKEVRQNFEENIGYPDVFFRNLFLLKGRALPEKKSVIIMDEVQLFPTARQAIKYLVADGRYDYIETGSLISIKKNVHDILIPSDEYKLKMYPMDFEEFLWANGNTITAPAIRDAFERKKSLGSSIHRKIMKDFRTYLVVGGMPQAVLAFAEGKNFEQIDFIKRNILSLYEDDLKKYDDDDHEKAAVVYKTIPEQLEKRNSHFKFSLVDKNARYRNYIDAVDFIAESMIGSICLNVTAPEVSLEAYADRSNFKLYMGDTGLLVTQIMMNSSKTGTDIYKALIFDNLGINQGMVLENATAQMLRSNGYSLYFHEFTFDQNKKINENKYEIDFLIVRKKKICPIEVKSSGYRSHKSFDNFARKYPIKIEDRFVIYSKDVQFENGITYIPFYMTMCL